MVVAIMKGYTIFVIILMLLYTARHFYFTIVRLLGRQRLYYNDILTDRMKSISVLIPMHNEEQVLSNVLDSLLKCEYDRDRLEIIPINDNSTDRTREMLDEYHRKYEFIRPLHRDCPDRGKPVGLNDAMKLAKGEIIIVFDADYRPARNMLKQIALGFEDPQVGAVMGRVIPYNTNTNMLTRLINLERSGGYQVDQQARYNLKTIPQYGGTVGGFRKDFLLETGGFNPKVLAEDTELTYRLFTNGWLMSELILKGTELFMEKTGSADKLHISGNTERMLFLILGILLVFAGAKVYRLIVSFIMFWGVTIALCTVMDGKTGWGTIVTAFTILGCLMGYMAFKWKTADSMILSAMTAAAVVWMCYPFWWVVVIFAAGAAAAAAFFPMEGAILSSVAAGMFLLHETGVRYVVLLTVCGLLFQIVLFERKSERGREIWKRFFAKKSNI